MNMVSWFLYGSDLVDKIGNFCFAVLITGVFVGIMGLIFGPMILMMLEDTEITSAQIARAVKTAAIVWCCAAVLYVFIPSKNTLYAIAASEVGEKVVQSEAVQGIASDAQKALAQWIKRQIEPEKKS